MERLLRDLAASTLAGCLVIVVPLWRLAAVGVLAILLAAAFKIVNGVVDRWNRRQNAALERELAAAMTEHKDAVRASTERSRWAPLLASVGLALRRRGPDKQQTGAGPNE